MLARSILPWIIAHVFSVIIGLGWSFWVTSRLLPVHYTWLERWNNLAIRFYNWYKLAQQGGTSYDNLMFIFQMSVIVWLMGYLTIWFIFRSGRVWPAIVPGGLVLLINLYYAPTDITFWFILYMLVALLLIIRFNLFSQEQAWRAEGIFFRPDISFDFLRDGFIVSALVIGFAWLTPPLVNAKTLGLLDDFQGSWRDMQNEWNRMFADLNYRDRQSFDSFGSSLKLGGPRRLTEEPVMDVTVSGTGRYWRAVTYDYYSGDGWLTRDEDKANFGPNETPSLPNFEAREAVTQTFVFYHDNATVLYAMPNPVSLDRSAKVTFTQLSEQEIAQAGSPIWSSEEGPWVEEITYIRSNATVDKGESYQVVSLASRATVGQLEIAGNDYPAWITERYLQLPDSVTERTRELALQITDTYDNNFGRAQAIERYLRNNINYNESIAAPPPNIDKVDYILFTAKEAYCDYYASAMIVMLRSIGIPARLAAGYAQGTFNSDTDSFHVLNKDAHSWVEVYFPKYGWIEFEPTAAQPNIIRLISSDGSLTSGAFLNNDPSQLEDVPERPPDPLDDEAPIGGPVPFIFRLPLFGTLILPRSVVSGGVAFVGVIILAALVAGGFWWRKQNQVNPEENVSVRYERMVKFASWMGVMLWPWQTPYEHAAVLQRNLPAHQSEVEMIANDYVFQTFSNKNGAGPEYKEYSSQAYQTAVAWTRLRTAMIKEAFRRRLPKWLRR